jgi:protein MAK11
VKAVDTLTVAVPPYSEPPTSATYASTVSSDGHIRLYDLGDVVRGLSAHATEQPVIIEPVTQYDTKGSRLTCVTMGDGEMVDSPKVAGGKRKREEGGVEGNVVDEWPSDADAGDEAGEDSDVEQEDKRDEVSD